ncbi:4-hydroxybenzoate transporter PcaK [Sporomusa ovata DSM 2662]|uniref:Benzoate MFS transporter BenK n=1 Tax=Sporomusa ovata TaxID=2378 RepID=A0A0U1KTY9_9FIRM|nr:aromatic acid/H+ symport family MFS transporter [Sporomusa ovata]EQB26810.1 gallate transporter [Sporomusa ovata DSM 2662]CQR70910.1 benzoate MFS transporter BenK [Sporomusa ovata]
MASNFTISEVIDSFGVNKFTWSIFFFLGMSMVFDGYDYMVVSYTMPQISAEWALSKVQTGSLSSWSLFGLIIGGALAGIISDKIGRRKTLIYSIAAYSLLSIPIYFVQSFEWFAFFRVLTGVGLGACIPVVTTMFSETTPTNRRALFITFGMAWMIVGWVLGGLIPTFVVPLYGWRLCYLIGGIPFLYAIFLHFKMRESAHWLANKGRKDDAVKVLQAIERIATGKVTDWDPNSLSVPLKSKVVGPKALFSKDYRLATAGIWLTYFCGCFIVYGINAWLPSLMLEKGLKLSSAYGLAIANNAAAVFANASTGIVAEIIGRRKNLICSYFIGGASIFIMAFVPSNFAAILTANIFMGFAINYAITAVQPLMAESYPTEFRNTGVSWCQAFGRLGGALAPMVAGLIMAMNLGPQMSFLFYIIPAIIGGLAAYFFVKKETKGKSIDQLAEKNTEVRLRSVCGEAD